MTSLVRRTTDRALPTVVVLAVTLALIAAVVAVVGPRIARSMGWLASAAPNPAQPGNFTGFAFDQCNAPSQSAMDAWRTDSPYLGVGVYISGDSRACRAQPNLTSTWVRTQITRGWKLLPITLGPQASCNPRFPRYGTDKVISPTPGSSRTYPIATQQGVAEAKKAVSAAKAIGINPGSTLYYDLEAFDLKNVNCRWSSMRFLSGWSSTLKSLGYVSGAYSSAASGIKALDYIRANGGGTYTLPTQIWIADWDGNFHTTTAYIPNSGWAPHRRVKQYQGGHNETHGGVTINIDNDFIDTGLGTVAPKVTHCARQVNGGINVTLASYPWLGPNTSTYTPNVAAVKAMKCLLAERAGFTGELNGYYGTKTVEFVKQWQTNQHLSVTGTWGRGAWMRLMSGNGHPILKYGSGSESVRDLQRLMNIADPNLKLPVTGALLDMSAAALRSYKARYDLPVNSITEARVWWHLMAGKV